MSGAAADRAERPISFTAPFRHLAFTVIWTATLVSNAGGWMYSAASGWLMTSLDPDPLIVALVQVSDQIEEAARAKDARKVETLNQRADDLEKQLGPEYRALFDALNSADPNSNDVLDIMSMFDKLDDPCPH